MNNLSLEPKVRMLEVSRGYGKLCNLITAYQLMHRWVFDQISIWIFMKIIASQFKRRGIDQLPQIGWWSIAERTIAFAQIGDRCSLWGENRIGNWSSYPSFTQTSQWKTCRTIFDIVSNSYYGAFRMSCIWMYSRIAGMSLLALLIPHLSFNLVLSNYSARIE